MTNNVIDLLEQLRKTCATGRNYGNHPYDVTRYVEMLGLIDQLYARMTTANLDQIDPMDTTGYVTPKVGINGVVKREDGCILLEQREDDERWGIPGGWAEVGLTAEENMKKEMLEETGFVVSVDQLVGVMSRRPTSTYPFSSYHLLYKCSIVSGTLTVSHESVSVDWIHPEKVDPWHFDHHDWIDYYLNWEKTINS